MSVRARVVGPIALVVACGLAGCGDDDEPSTSSSPPAPTSAASASVDLDGRTFTATEAQGYALVAGSTVRLTFEAGRVAADAGCNTLTGAATWDDGVLDAEGPLASTLKGCSPELLAQDTWLDGFLTSRPALVLDGDTLTLGDDQSGMVLTGS